METLRSIATVLLFLVATACIPTATSPPATVAPTPASREVARGQEVAGRPAQEPVSKAPADKPAELAWMADYVEAAKRLRSNPTEWERIKEAAKQEGRVVVVGPGFPALRDGVIEGFQRAYGIAVEYLGLPSGEVITRVDRESRVGNVTVDVNIGGTSSCWIMAERGQIDDVTSLLVDPSIYDPSIWWGGVPRLILPSPKLPQSFMCGLQTAEWVMTDLFVNNQIIPPSSITSWRDLLKPEFRGRIAAFDPRRAGPGQTPAGYLYALFGEQYVRDLYIGQQVVLTTDNRQLAEWVARGTYPIGIALVQAAVEPLRAQGLPLERVFPEDGPGALTGGFGTVHKIKGGPHPNAAAVFINWFASREAQEMYERAMLETSLRTDVPHQVPEYVIPRPGVNYSINDYHPGYFFSQREPAIAKLQELLGR